MHATCPNLAAAINAVIPFRGSLHSVLTPPTRRSVRSTSNTSALPRPAHSIPIVHFNLSSSSSAPSSKSPRSAPRSSMSRRALADPPRVAASAAARICASRIFAVDASGAGT